MTDDACPVDTSQVKSAIATDPIMCLLKNTIYNGWPDYRNQCAQELWDYWNFRCDLVLEDGLVLKGDKVVVPKSIRAQVLRTIHSAHQGESKCLLLARQAVFWPGISTDIRKMVKDVSHVTNINQLNGNSHLCNLIYRRLRGRNWVQIFMNSIK